MRVTVYLGYNQFTARTFRWLLDRIAALTAAGQGDGMTVRLLDEARSLWWPLELYAQMRQAEWGKAIVLYDRYLLPAA